MISELKTVPGHIVHTEPVVWQPTVIVQSHLLSCTDVVLRKDRSFRGVCGQDGMHRPKSAPSVRVTPMRNVGDAMETVIVLVAMSVAIPTAGLLFAIVLPVILPMPVTVPTGTTVTRRLPPRLRFGSDRGEEGWRRS